MYTRIKHFFPVSMILFFLGVSTLLAQHEKIVIAMLNLRNTSGVTSGEAELLSDRLRIDLFNTQKFAVMERNQMSEILKEQGFQQSGACTDQGCMVEIGQLLGVHQLVAGSIGKLGSMFLVNLRSIDIQTGKIHTVVSEDVRGELEDVVEVLPIIAARLAGDTPIRKTAQTPVSDRAEEQENDHHGTIESEWVTDSPVYLVASGFNIQNTPIKLSEDEFQDLNQEIDEELLSAFNEVFNDKVALASQNQAETIERGIIIKLFLNAYSTKPDIMDQQTGQADVTICFYSKSLKTVPVFKTRIRKTGERHWGESVPFENAFEAIAEDIEDDLEDIPWIKELIERLER